ncbi:MAG: Stp1/IreP family PP2C-type Ser/Thr phosphatase, partial [Myxococcota bacterium]
MSRPLGDKIQSFALTDVGLTRSENQDACALFSTKGQSLVAVVADGMGGHAGGATASRIVIETIRDWLLPTRDEVDGETLANAIEDANQRIYAKAQDEPGFRGMGTTVVALLFHPDYWAWVAHVGDSRAYRLRGNSFEQLTHDHSVVADLVRKGQLSEEEAEVDPRRNEILRSVGVAPTVEVDVNAVSVRPGDRFLLCSDGLTGPVQSEDISSILALYDPEDATRTLIAWANEMGSPDNVTAIALHYTDPDSETDNI